MNILSKVELLAVIDSDWTSDIHGIFAISYCSFSCFCPWGRTDDWTRPVWSALFDLAERGRFSPVRAAWGFFSCFFIRILVYFLISSKGIEWSRGV